MDWDLRLEKSPGVVVLSYNLSDSSPLFHVKMLNLSARLCWGDFPSCCCLLPNTVRHPGGTDIPSL